MQKRENDDPEYAVVGKGLPRVDSLSKVTGAALYSGDVALPNMLYGKVLRSPFAHAKLKRLNTVKALALTGVKAVVTAADVPGYKAQTQLELAQLPRLAQDKVNYAGQPVAAVAATSLEIAEQALELIEVEYEEMAPVLDVTEAMKPGAPIIHADLRTSINMRPAAGRGEPTNVAATVTITRGDLEAGFRQADVVLENTFRTQKVHHGYIEPMAAVATVDALGKITVWTQCQGIFMARHMLSQFLDLPVDRIKVVPVEVGGGFGGKSYQPLAPLCALIALRTRRPVRMEMTREEVLRDGRHGPETLLTVKIGATRSGLFTAASAHLVFDAGAFPEMSHSMFCGHNVFGQYKIGNVKIEAKDVLTNKVPSTYYRAPGTPQHHFAIESQIDMLAEVLGMDPLKLRIQNTSAKGDPMPSGEILPSVGFRAALERMAAYLEEKGPVAGKNRGRGVASGFWHGATGAFGATVNLNADGSVNLVLGVSDISGVRTSMAQIVAEEFCLPLEKVRVIIGDTDTAPWATMSVGSMTAYSLSTATFRACQDAKEQLASRAAARLELDPQDLEFIGGRFQVKGSPDQSISVAELAAAAVALRGGAGPIAGQGSVGSMPFSPTLSVHAVDLEVDEETGNVKLLSYVAAQDVGRALNPLSVIGQIQGAVGQGMGLALTERVIFEKGVVQNADLADYRIPTATDLPMVEVMIVEVPSDEGVYGVRHVGEPPMVACLAAIGNAIYNACGVRMKETPMTPEAILKAIKGDKEK